MPHYKDGTEAKPGDVVRGKGYNLKDANGELREFIGTLLHVTPGATACNVQVGVIEVNQIGPFDPENASHLLNITNPGLTEEQVRRIVREEIAAALASQRVAGS